MHLQLETLLLRYSDVIAGFAWAILALFAGAGFSLLRLRFRRLESSDFPSSEPELAAPPITMAAMAVKLDSETEGSPKGRFTAYFESEEGNGVEEEKDMDEVGKERQDLFGLRWGNDLGWYMHQDMAVINGSVVRLWHGRRNG